MASSWADKMAEEAGMPALNFTALLDDAQTAARNGLSSGDEETAATPGQRREGSRARAADRAVNRPPDIQPASPAAATSASTRPALQPREQQFDQRGAPPPPFIARPDPKTRRSHPRRGAAAWTAAPCLARRAWHPCCQQPPRHRRHYAGRKRTSDRA